MEKIDNKILGKIKKCLALSTSSEPHEAAAALRQAQALMAKYGATSKDVLKSDIGDFELKSKFSVSKMKSFEVRLVKETAKAFGCKVLFRSSNSYSKDVYATFILIGLKSQIELAHYTCEVMLRKLVKARAEFVKGMKIKCLNISRSVLVQEADGFSQGWANAVVKTINEFAMADDVKAIINDVVSSRSNGESTPQNRRLGRNGMMAGIEQGSKESIYRPMNESKFAKLGA